MQKQSLKEARDLEKLGKKSAQSTSGGYLPDGGNMALDLDIFEQRRWQWQLANAGVQRGIFPIINNDASDGSTAEYLQVFRW